MRRIVIIPLFSFLISFSLGTASASSSPGPVSVIQDLWKEIQASAGSDPSSREDFIKVALERHFDFEGLYGKALQDHWPSWTESQKEEFGGRFRRVFLKNLARKIRRLPASGGELTSTGLTFTGPRAKGAFKGRKGEKEIGFKVFFVRRDGDWKICDVEVEGALLSRNYRAQFNRILRNENFGGLLARLDNKLSD